ncbi:fimbrial protein [Herbaspirillum sp. YR522]|uniref:fimbrial protein n=1 Tax=Herbaspirillum sp. YR522 TaxID=1144342 RepID=UPI00026F883F|nr:fimbrial protein [Herbaspirillum sp. YR522]EJN06934.1 P pilus assembly protein, pilin FimA [Herbaspirillum sp. YR522]
MHANCTAISGAFLRYRHAALALSIALFSVQAQAALYCGGTNASTGFSWFESSPPADLVIPATTPNNRIIWESPPITISGVCWNARGHERLTLWINPDASSAGPHLSLGVRYGGRLVTYNEYRRGTPLETNVTFGGRGFHPFSISFTYVLIKRTDIPAHGAWVHLPLIQLDTYDALNNMPGTPRVRFLVTGGSVRTSSGTCQLSVGSRATTIMLPVVRSSTMAQTGSTAGRVPFALKVENCNASLRLARFSFAGTASTSDARYFGNIGTANGVDLRLSTDTGAVISPLAPGNVIDVALAEQQGNLPLVAEYVRTAEMTPGTLRTQATVSISYH